MTTGDAGRWLRQPAQFIRWRPDREPADCHLDQLGHSTTDLTAQLPPLTRTERRHPRTPGGINRKGSWTMRRGGSHLLASGALCAALLTILTLGVLPAAEHVASAQSAAAYTIVDLGTVGDQWAGASSINESGQIVGTSFDFDWRFQRISGGYHALFWPDGTPQSMLTIGPVPDMGHDQSRIGGINNNGVVIGGSWTDRNYGTNGRAWRYENGVHTNLGAPGTKDSMTSQSQPAPADARRCAAGRASQCAQCHWSHRRRIESRLRWPGAVLG